MEKELLIILWEGVQEYETFEGSLEDAIKHVRSNRRYSDYGRTGAVIVKATKLYEIRQEVVEWTHTGGNCGLHLRFDDDSR